MKMLIFLLLSLAMAACTSPRSGNQADLFRQSGGGDAADYRILAAISVEAMEYFLAEQYAAVATFLDGIEERLDDPEELQRYLLAIREINERSRLDMDPEWTDFVGRLRPGDELYLFEYRRQYYNDFGLLVIRDGEIVFRTVWESAWPAGMDSERPIESEFDRL
jgi:hypothetical protein